MKRYFTTATGTDIGKTFVTAALTWQLRRQGHSVQALKPIASGVNEEHLAESDGGQLLAAQGLPLSAIDRVSPWRFTAPLSPDMAAKAQDVTLTLEEIVRFCNADLRANVQLIEGAGGVMTPLTHHHTMLDLAAALGVPVILVTGSYVGAISHTLTALAALQSRQLAITTIIINETTGSAASPHQTMASLRQHITPQIHMRVTQRLDSGAEIWKNAADLTEGLV